MTAPLDVAKLIDERPVSWFQWRVLFVCMAVALLDGLGLQSVGVAAPSLLQLWHIPRGELGPVFAAAPLGMIFGGLLMGPLADRIGRRRQNRPAATQRIGRQLEGRCRLDPTRPIRSCRLECPSDDADHQRPGHRHPAL